MKSLYTFCLFLVMTNSLLTQGLNGDYTVGGPYTNFPTIEEAVQVLLEQGVAGPVTMNIRSGVYENAGSTAPVIDIPAEIEGASESNDVIFRPDANTGATVDSVILRRRLDGTPGIEGWVVRLRSSFVRLENLTLDFSQEDGGLGPRGTTIDINPADGFIENVFHFRLQNPCSGRRKTTQRDKLRRVGRRFKY